ncbi:MAG: transcriptional regulator NrdR, partial [Ilumatobacteraceae bacterium]
GRPVSAEQIEQLADAIEDEVRLQGPDVPTAVVGMEVLERLRRLDEVAYLRFASVYKGFDAAADFQRELVLLKKLQRS